jgi:hypothetical protein
MKYLISTKDYVALIPQINQSINIIQIIGVPQYFINVEKLEGKAKCDLLKQKVDCLFEFEMPCQPDFSPLISPNKAFLDKVLERIK